MRVSETERPVYLTVVDGEWGPELVATTDSTKSLDSRPVGVAVPPEDEMVRVELDPGTR